MIEQWIGFRPFARILAASLGFSAVGAICLEPSAEPPPYAQFDGRPLDFLQGGKYVVGVYVANWQPASVVDSMKGNDFSHVMFAFLRACGPGQSVMEADGCVGHKDFTLASTLIENQFDEAFKRLKERSPHVKVLASIGGWGGSDPFFYIASNAQRRATFAASVAEFLRTHAGFDGVDIDWEYPTTNGSATGVKLGAPKDGARYADLILCLRTTLDGLSRVTKRRYLLTSAIGTSKELVEKIDYRRAGRSLDYIFMMTYDFYNSTTVAGNHSSLSSPSVAADDSLEAATSTLLSAGVPGSKLVAGVAMYGYGFSGVKRARFGESFNGAVKSGNWPQPDGALTYREIRSQYLGRQGEGTAGFTSIFDGTSQAWNLYNDDRRLLLGYDDPRAVVAKGLYVRRTGLAGLFAWEYSQDNGDILNAMNYGVGNQIVH